MKKRGENGYEDDHDDGDDDDDDEESDDESDETWLGKLDIANDKGMENRNIIHTVKVIIFIELSHSF